MKKTNNHIIMLVGNIASGKSTISKDYVINGYRTISRDAIRYMVGSGNYIFDRELEPIIRKASHALLEEFLKDNVNIVYDETNICTSLRKPTIELAKKYGYKITAIVLPIISKEKSVNRRLKNNHGGFDRDIWNSIWNNFNNIYEEPNEDEGIDEVVFL